MSDHGGGPRFTVDTSGQVTDKTASINSTMETLRDGYMWATKKKGTYVAGYDPVTQRYAYGRSSNPFGCAERDVSRKLGIPMDQIYYSKAVYYQSVNKQYPINVCRNCQIDSEKAQYQEGT